MCVDAWNKLVNFGWFWFSWRMMITRIRGTKRLNDGNNKKKKRKNKLVKVAKRQAQLMNKKLETWTLSSRSMPLRESSKCPRLSRLKERKRKQNDKNGDNKHTDLLTIACCIPGGGATAEAAGGAETADWGGGPLEACVDPALWGASNGVVLWACCVCNPPE